MCANQVGLHLAQMYRARLPGDPGGLMRFGPVTTAIALLIVPALLISQSAVAVERSAIADKDEGTRRNRCGHLAGDRRFTAFGAPHDFGRSHRWSTDPGADCSVHGRGEQSAWYEFLAVAHDQSRRLMNRESPFREDRGSLRRGH